MNIEAMTALDMARRQIMPACMDYAGKLAQIAYSLKQAGVSSGVPDGKLQRLVEDIEALQACESRLEQAVSSSQSISDKYARATACRDEVIVCMKELRLAADRLETTLPSESWPFPTYADLLYRVR